MKYMYFLFIIYFLFVQVKEQLAQGTITKQDVEELEKVMGTDITQLVQMVNSGQVDKRSLGKEFGEMIDIFKKLAEIKKR